METVASAEQDAGGEEQHADASAVVPAELLVQLLVQLLEASRSLQETLEGRQVVSPPAAAAADWWL